MAQARDPARKAPSDARRRRLLGWLPLIAGAVVLAFCGSGIALALALNGGANCFERPGLRGVGDHVAFQMHIWNQSGLGSALALVIYAVVCLLPYALLSGCVRLAARGRTTLLLVVLAFTGTAFVALFDALGFWTAYDDLQHGGLMCGLAFDLLPIGGLIAGACAATAGTLAGLLIDWRWHARTRG